MEIPSKFLQITPCAKKSGLPEITQPKKTLQAHVIDLERSPKCGELFPVAKNIPHHIKFNESKVNISLKKPHTYIRHFQISCYRYGNHYE